MKEKLILSLTLKDENGEITQQHLSTYISDNKIGRKDVLDSLKHFNTTIDNMTSGMTIGDKLDSISENLKN